MEFSWLDFGIGLSIGGLTATGLSGILGIWIDRDRERPRRYAFALTLLVIMTSTVAVGEVVVEAREKERLEADIARILETLDAMAAESEDEALDQFVTQEMHAQSRQHPRVVRELTRRVQAQGRDAKRVLERRLDPSDLPDSVRALLPADTPDTGRTDTPRGNNGNGGGNGNGNGGPSNTPRGNGR